MRVRIMGYPRSGKIAHQAIKEAAWLGRPIKTPGDLAKMSGKNAPWGFK
jgi:hypothetical protein